MKFIPTPKSSFIKAEEIPWFDDTKGTGIPGNRARKELGKFMDEIEDLMSELGADRIRFHEGMYAGGEGQPERHGYQVTFELNEVKGRLDVAALPMRSETAQKRDRALAMALTLLRNWLQSEVYSHLYRPGSIALIPFLIGHDGKTVTESLSELYELPMLKAGG